MAEDSGLGVKPGLRLEEKDWVGLEVKEGKTSYLRTREPVLISTVALLKKSIVTSDSLSFLEAEPVTKESINCSSSADPKAG